MVHCLQMGALRLVPLDISHAHAFVLLANEPSISARVNHAKPFTIEHFVHFLAQVMEAPTQQYVWMMEQEGVICGMINAATMRNPQIFQGGYWVSPHYRGRGIAIAALALVKEHLFTHCHAVRLQALVEPDNASSIRVLERNGYVCEGLLKRYYARNDVDLVDVYMYAAIAS